MLYYYYNPKSQDLIIFDTEEKEIFIVEKIKNVQVFTEDEMRMGDFGRGDLGRNKKKNKSDKTRITPEIIEQIKKLKKEGKSGRAIAEELMISEPSVWKYLRK